MGELKPSRLALLPALLLAGPAPARAQSTERASVDSAGQEADMSSTYNGSGASISADGRLVAFESIATNLVPFDQNLAYDVFVRDRQLGTTLRVSVDSAGGQVSGDSHFPALSADGRFVAFRSISPMLVNGDTNGFMDIFVKDLQSGAIEIASRDSGGLQGNGNSFVPAISADGRFVAFYSAASNLVPGDTNGVWDVFVRDRLLGTTERASVDSAAVEGNGASSHAVISADGRFVAFESLASNLVPGDGNGVRDVFVRDRLLGTTERVSLDSGLLQGNGASSWPALSADGRWVVFQSYASNLVPGDANATGDVFLRDRLLGTTERMSVDGASAETDDVSLHPWISADGQRVVFESYATDLVPGDTNGLADVFERDRMHGTLERISLDSGALQANGNSGFPACSGEGRWVVFQSGATNLVAGDTNAAIDIFVRDRGPISPTFCTPGVAGVGACPCANPPGGPDRGCNNSAATGGAFLGWAGAASLAADSLVFTTGAEKPTATSVVLQGTSSSPAGVAFGQGVRCVAGLLKRLYVKTASGGSITAPGAGDPPVSQRSAALGDPISAGQHRFYTVYYRDPSVLGGCPATSTFNSTDALDLEWGN